MGPTSLMIAGFLLLCSVTMVEPAKILFLYPIPYPSHYSAYSPLIKELAKRGHQITAYTTIPGEKSDKNFQHIPINVDMTKITVPEIDPIVWRSRNTFSFLSKIFYHFLPFFEVTLQSKEIQALMQSDEKFDLMIVEAAVFEESILAFSHKFKVPVVTLFPFFVSPWMAQSIGIPHAFSYIPHHFFPYLGEMDFWQRTQNAIIGLFDISFYNLFYLPTQEKIMREHFKYPGSENLPSLRQMISNISLNLINSHHLMTSVRPYTPNVIDVAGMNLKTAKKLPQDLQKFMDEATEGVIYFSFGTFFPPQSLSYHFTYAIVETLKGVKQRVIMNWNGTIEGAPHILTKTWLPQQEILAHPNCKLFITHGGFNSLMEAMSVGVPIIGIPIIFDQSRNIVWVKHKGVGLEIVYESITVSELSEKINRVLHTSSFRENAKKIAELYHDEPQSSLEKAVFWVEYVIRHKGAHHLKPVSAKMPYYQYLLLDVVAFLAVSVFLTVFIVVFLFCKIMRLCTDRFYVSEEKKQK